MFASEQHFNCNSLGWNHGRIILIFLMRWNKSETKDWSEKNGTDIFAYYSGSIIGTMYYYTNFKNIGS